MFLQREPHRPNRAMRLPLHLNAAFRDSIPRTASGNGHAGKTLSTLEKTVSTLEISIGTLEKTLSTFGKPAFMTMEKDMRSTKPFLSFV